MSATVLNPTDPYSLLRIGEAWRNRPGVTTLLTTFVAAALLWGLGAISGSFGLMGLLGLLATAVWLMGTTAAGSQFMAQASGHEISPTMTALAASPMIVLRMIGLGLIGLLAFLAYLLLAAIVLFVCKIPLLGVVLYVVALPVLTFLGALVFLSLYVIFMLAAPALWEGHSLRMALSQLWAIVTQRPVEAFLNLITLFIVTWLIFAFVAGFVFAGFGAMAGLSASILGGEIMGGMSGAMGPMMSGGYGRMAGGGGGSGLAMAGVIGGALVFAITAAMLVSMIMLGLALTYLKVTGGIDVVAAQSALDSVIDKTKEKVAQGAAEAKRRAQAARAAAAPPPSVAPAAPLAPTATAAACPACHAVITPDDVFCGSCGHKLR